MKFPGYRNGPGGAFCARSANSAEDLVVVKRFRIATVKETSWCVHRRVDPAGTEENAQRIVRGTNMAWENAVISENQDNVEASLTEREYEANIPVRAAAVASRNRQVMNGNTVNDGFEDIVGASGALREVLNLVRTVALTSSTVLVVGETGTG